MSFNIVSLFNGCHYSRQAARVVGCVYTKCLAALYLFTAHQIDITRSRLGSSYIQNSPLLNIRTFVNRNIWRRVIIRKLSTCAIPLACRNFRFVSAEQLSQGGGGARARGASSKPGRIANGANSTVRRYSQLRKQIQWWPIA
jgi:hypothetical protein